MRCGGLSFRRKRKSRRSGNQACFRRSKLPRKTDGRIKKDGYAIVPLEVYLENGWAKIEIALAKGKKLYDKRDDLAKKAQARDIDRAVKSRG